MPTCDHFIYTTARTNLKTGYQVIAKSKGVTEKLLNNLANYLYPLGVNSTEFKESKSLLLVDKGHIAYSTVKNIGMGYDGRSGTIYNHTIIMKKEDFEKMYYDTRIFDKYFIEDYESKNELEQLYIQPEKLEIDFNYLQKLDRNFLSSLLYYLFKKSKIAIVKAHDENLIQNLLSVIPPQIRLMSYSTLVLEPSRQSKYQIIQIPIKVQSKLESNYAIINLDALPLSKAKQGKDIGIQNLVDLIYSNNQKEILHLHRDFEKITDQVSKIKRVKIKDIFDKEHCEELAKGGNFFMLEKYVRNIYTNPDFNKSSPRTMVSITKKISKIIKKSLKEYEKGTFSNNDLVKLTSISKILFDCLHYVKEYNEKKMGDIITSEIELEITKLESIMQQYPETASILQDYEFNVYNYFKTLFENALYSAYSMTLWFLGRKW